MTENIRPAGIASKSFGETAAVAFQSNGLPEKITPPKRPSVPDIIFGARSKKSESVEKCFDAMRKTGLIKILSEHAERAYKSATLEPLGKSYSRSHTLPPSGFVYGKPPAVRECSTGDIIFPKNTLENPETKSIYKRTHHSFDAGEQLKRDYVLPSQTSRTDFAYGYKDKECTTTIEEALRWTSPDDGSRIMSTRLANFIHATRDKLGRSRNLLQGPIPVPAGHSFGMHRKSTTDTAYDCIHRNYTSTAELMPDPDLGKSHIRIAAG